MNTNKEGLELIKEFEGCRLTAYKCPAGVWTIGYGHTSGVVSGMTCSASKAEQWLKQDLIKCETEVTAWNYRYAWTSNEFSALVSFCFNCGSGSFRNLIKNGNRNKKQIADAILLYNKDINGRQLAGLVRRRKAEQALFLKADGSEAPDKDYTTVEDICRGIWNGDFGTPWSKSDKLYKYFLSQINKGVGK